MSLGANGFVRLAGADAPFHRAGVMTSPIYKDRLRMVVGLGGVQTVRNVPENMDYSHQP